MLVPVATQACDICIKYHKRCTRELDGCQRCQRTNKDCTYTKILKRTKFKLNSDVKDKIKTFNVSDFMWKDQQLKMIKGNKIFTYNGDPMTNLIGITFSKELLNNTLKLKSTYNGFLSMLGGCIFNQNSNFNINPIIYSKLYSLMSITKPGKVNNFPIYACDEDWHLNQTETMKEAQRNYFEYLNSESPLFLETDFNFKKRSKNLMATMYLCGLVFMNKNKKTKFLYDQCFSIIIDFLTKLKFTPRLETLQIIIMIYNGLRHIRGLVNLIGRWLEIVGNLCHQLGLHLTPPKKTCNNYSLERKLCFVGILHISHIWLFVYNYPSCFYSHIYDSKIDLVTPALKLSKLKSDIGAMLVGETNYYQALTYIRFHENKLFYEKSYKSSEKHVQASIISLRKYLEYVYNKFIYLKTIGILSYRDQIYINKARSRYYFYGLIASRYLLLRIEKFMYNDLYNQQIIKCKENLQFYSLQILKHTETLGEGRKVCYYYGTCFLAVCYIYAYLDIEDPTIQNLLELGQTLIKHIASPLTNDSSPTLINHLKLIDSVKSMR